VPIANNGYCTQIAGVKLRLLIDGVTV
jgi:hypothetical protein